MNSRLGEERRGIIMKCGGADYGQPRTADVAMMLIMLGCFFWQIPVPESRVNEEVVRKVGGGVQEKRKRRYSYLQSD